MKKIKIILSVIIAILVICLIILIATKKKNTRNIVINNNNTTSQTLEINNYTTLSRIYKGEENISKFNGKIKEIAEDYFPNVAEETSKMDSSELKTYFEKNKSEILLYVGIEEFEDFQNLVTVLRNATRNKISIQSVNIDLSNYIEDENYAKFSMTFVNENGKKIEFNAFLNMKNNPSRYIKLIPEI